MVLNELIRAYGWMGLVLPEMGLLRVGLGFLGLQDGARPVIMGRAST